MNDTSAANTRPLSRFLKIAIMAGVESAIRIHINRGDDLNARDGNGLTPLMLAAAKNRSSICKLLLDAGADDRLVSPSGKTAFAIAIASGAHEAAAVLELIDAQTADCMSEQKYSADIPNNNLELQDPEQFSDLINDKSIEDQVESPIIPLVIEAVIEKDIDTDFDLSGWEPEESLSPPVADVSVADTAKIIQTTITEFEPIDSSQDWGEIDAYLPERSLPLPRTDDTEARERLRLAMLRAFREGSVPSMLIEALSINDDRSRNPEGEALLSMVVNDLGAEVDERFEYTSNSDNFEVFVKPEETPEEEEVVTDTLRFIDSLASPQTEPLRIYQKEFQRQKLISAEEEVLLSQAMESALEKALDNLAAWPRGIALTLAAGHLVKNGEKPLTWLFLGPNEVQPDITQSPESENDFDAQEHPQIEEEVESDDDAQFDQNPQVSEHTSTFLDTLSRLANLSVSTSQQDPRWHAVREALSLLRLNRRFLSELTDAANTDDLDSAVQYASAMTAYLDARERMTNANLKLVFHLAKKFRYSGEPLDDLAQEGNMGLLKAVERFDWRRGFKFSTYATWWIRQHIGRYIADKCRTIRVPVHVHEKTQRLFREARIYELETGRTPSPDELAARVGISSRLVISLQHLAPEPLPIHDIQVDEHIAVDVRSDFVLPDPFISVSASELRNVIDEVLSTLKPKEEKIIRLRYGIGVNDSLTLEDVGQRYQVTRERVRQIEAKAIKKLKQPSKMDALAYAFFGDAYKKEVFHKNHSEPKEIEQSIESNSSEQLIATTEAPADPGKTFPKKTKSIDRLLAQAAELSIPVVDEREETSGKIWLNFVEAHDVRYRQFTRKLLALGFEFWPGKGYWR